MDDTEYADIEDRRSPPNPVAAPEGDERTDLENETQSDDPPTTQIESDEL